MLARATIQVPHMAEALGVDTRLIYSLTFGLGAALAGLTGGFYAPTMTMVPTMGATFIMEAFVTVVVGGADVFLGTAPAAAVLAVIKAAMTSWQGQVFGQIGTAGRRHHRDPRPAERHLRLAAARAELRGGCGHDKPSSFIRLLNGPQTLGRGPLFWTGFVLVVLAAAAYPLSRRLDGRQHRLLLHLDLHGARPLSDLGLWRRAELRPDRILRPRRLRLRRPHAQFRRGLRLHRPGCRCSPSLVCARLFAPCSATSCSSAASAASSSASSRCR